MCTSSGPTGLLMIIQGDFWLLGMRINCLARQGEKLVNYLVTSFGQWGQLPLGI